MIAFMLEELRDWRERRMRRTTVVSALVLAAVSAASLLQPLLVALAATAIFATLGWTEGNRYQSAQSARRLLISFPASPSSIAAGKAIAGLAAWSFFLVLLSAPLALSAIAWGVSGRAAAACVLAWFVGYFSTLCVGFLSSLLFVRTDGLPGLALVILWLTAPFYIPALAPSNPFIQVWDILKAEGGPAPFLGMGESFLAATALLFSSALALGAIRSKQHA